MKNFFSNLLKVAALSLSFTVSTAVATANSYIHPTSGSWGTATNWSAGVPTNGEDIFITNAASKTVTVDNTAPNSSLTVKSVTIASFGTATNTLLLPLAGGAPLHITGDLLLDEGSVVSVQNTNGLQVDGTATIAAAGTGSSSLTNTVLIIANSGFVKVTDLHVGETNNSAVLDLFGGSLQVMDHLEVAYLPFTRGTVNMTGGFLFHTNGAIFLGEYGLGTFLQSGGTNIAQSVQLGNGAGSQATYSLSGGVLNCSQILELGNTVGAGPCAFYVYTNGQLFVTNAAHTAVADVSLSGSLTLAGGLMQVDNLILTNGGSFTNLSGTLVFTQPFQLENGGSVTISGGFIGTPASFTMGADPGSTGMVFVANGGTLNITNTGATLGIGNDGSTTNGSGTGIATLANATINATTINLGSTAGGLGSFTLQSNAVVNLTSNLTVVSGSMTRTSTVTAGPGSMINAPNSIIVIGSHGAGQVIITGGSHVFGQVLEGSTDNLGSGFFHQSGGSVKIMGNGTGPGQGFRSNWFLWDGGDMDGSATSVTIGDGHDSAGYLSGNEVANYGAMYVGYTHGFTGTYTQTNGTMTVSGSLIVGAGDCSSGAVGKVTLIGGTMYVTNTSQTAVMDVINGTVVLGSGATLVVDTLIMTNGCGQFVKQPGGVLIEKNSPMFDLNLDADGDGQSNGSELAAGTDPLDPTSIFKMTGAAVSNLDVRVYWTTVGGHSYVVQTNGDLSHGVFNDLNPSTPVVVPGTDAGTTNYLQPNGATNRVGFYRVRLGQ